MNETVQREVEKVAAQYEELRGTFRGWVMRNPQTAGFWVPLGALLVGVLFGATA